jgi:hypothetical protein
MLRPCEVLTEGVLEAALRRELPGEQRTALLRHLREPCGACLDLLEGWTTEQMMATLYGQDDLLTRQEEERLFSAATSASSPRGRSPLRSVGPEHRRLPRLAWGVAAAALSVFALVTVLRSAQPGGEVGLKGAPKPTATLIPLAGARTPSPHVVRALGQGGRLAPGELLLLRIRLDAPAWVYLLSQKQGEAAELVWPVEAAARREAGEFELAESGTALAIDPSALGEGARLLLIASPKPIERSQLRIRESVRSREELEKNFSGCGVDVLPVLVETR